MAATDAALRLLGVDPGTTRTGFGLIEECRGRLVLLDAGALAPPADLPLAGKLAFLFAGLEELVARAGPHELAVEGLFHARNARSALVLGHARGVVLLVAARAHIPVFEYAPREVKKALVGTGGAEKQQVSRMVALLLGLRDGLSPHDAADAAAIAICHAHARRLAALARQPAVRPRAIRPR